MSTYLSDDFSEADGTNVNAKALDIGGSWSVLSGSWSVQTGQARPGSSASNNFAAADSSHADAHVSADVTLPSAGSFVSSGLYCRESSSTVGWLVCFEDDGSGKFVGIYERNGGNTLRASGTFTGSGQHSIKAILSGATINVYVDGSGSASATYSSATLNQTTTNHGIYCYFDGTYTSCDVDNFLTGDGVTAVDYPPSRYKQKLTCKLGSINSKI